jgi:hypothetical protein
VPDDPIQRCCQIDKEDIAPRRYAPPRHNAYTQQLEEERDLLMQRLRRLEQEVEDLRTRGRSPQA